MKPDQGDVDRAINQMADKLEQGKEGGGWFS